MRRTSLILAVVLVVGMLLAPAAAVAQDGDQDAEDSVAPGERLSGVVGVQEAEIDGEIERTAFTIALERADDNATRASHIAEKLNETEERLEDLEERKVELEKQREDGEITEGEYRAEIAQLAVEGETVHEQLNQSNETAGELPEETLEENGVNVTHIQELRQNASELTGEEVAAIAQSIAGDDRGQVDREDGDERPDDAEDREDDDDERPDDADDREDGDDERSDDADDGADGADEDAGADGDEDDDEADTPDDAGNGGDA